MGVRGNKKSQRKCDWSRRNEKKNHNNVIHEYITKKCMQFLSLVKSDPLFSPNNIIIKDKNS